MRGPFYPRRDHVQIPETSSILRFVLGEDFARPELDASASDDMTFVPNFCLLMVSVVELLVLFICYQRGKGHCPSAGRWPHRHLPMAPAVAVGGAKGTRRGRNAAPSARASCHPVTSHSAKCLHSGHWEGLWVIFIECLAYASHTITPNADHVTFRLENGMWIEWLCHNMVNVPPCHRPCSPSISGRAWRPWAVAALPGVEGAAH